MAGSLVQLGRHLLPALLQRPRDRYRTTWQASARRTQRGRLKDVGSRGAQAMTHVAPPRRARGAEDHRDTGRHVRNVVLHRDQTTCQAPTNDVAAGCLLVSGSSWGLSEDGQSPRSAVITGGNLLRELAGCRARCRAKLASPLANTSRPVADNIAVRGCCTGQLGRFGASPLLLSATQPRSAFSRGETKMYWVSTNAKAADNNLPR